MKVLDRRGVCLFHINVCVRHSRNILAWCVQVLVWKELDYGTMAEVEKRLLVSEVNLLRELRHPNIVRYYDRIIDRAHTTLYIVMEYCQGGDLASLINKCIRERYGVHADT